MSTCICENYADPDKQTIFDRGCQLHFPPPPKFKEKEKRRW